MTLSETSSFTSVISSSKVIGSSSYSSVEVVFKIITIVTIINKIPKIRLLCFFINLIILSPPIY